MLTVSFYSNANAQLNADFIASSVSGCSPLNIRFTDKSTGSPTSWYWDFGNGMNSDAQNPVAAYANPGTYSVRLIIRNSSGQNYILKNNFITVNATPQASFTKSISNGCLPLAVSFSNTTNLFGAGVKNWTWDFGDGNTSSQQDASNTYTTRGSFNVRLAVETNAGCVDTFSLARAVQAGNKPASVSFKANPLKGCASTLRKFTDMSSGQINSWSWTFGDGGKSNLKNPSYHYTDTGWFSVKLIAADNGCIDSVLYSHYLHIDGPIAKIYRYIHCINRLQADFLSQSIGEKSRIWYFGDGDTSSSRIPSHLYKDTGVYNVRLIVTGQLCTDTANYTAYIVNQKPSYTISPIKNSYCKNDTITFSAINYDTSVTRYLGWSFDSGNTKKVYTPNFFQVKKTYTTNGTLEAPFLYVYNKDFCNDTIQKKSLVISGPIANYISSAPACAGLLINFLDHSISANNITNHQWDFGDGDSAITSTSQDNYKFPFSGLYNVLLKVTDSNGCTDTISHQINIADTPTIDAGQDAFICEGKSVTLQPSGGVSYIWDSDASLSCTSCSNPIATPTDTTEFYVTGKDTTGCTARDSLMINVAKKKQVSVNPQSDTICAGNSVQLTAFGYDNFSWTPVGTLSNISIANPVATPLSNTVYTVTSTDKAGCFSQSASVNIIANPKPTAIITDTAVTISPGSLYQIKASYSADVVKWEWQPAQWLSDATVANPVASPLQTITYTVYASTASGCVSVSHTTITVICNKTIVFIPNTFSPNGDGVNDYFFPRSPGALKIKSLKIFNRWGQEVFNKEDFLTNDQAAGWDGKYKGVSQQSDVYPYIVTFLCINGSTFFQKGSITLLR